MKTHTLSNGIIISEGRNKGYIIDIKNNKFDYYRLGYEIKLGFYIIPISYILYEKEHFKSLQKELKLMKTALTEANKILNNK